MEINTFCPHCKESNLIELDFKYFKNNYETIEFTLLCHKCLKTYYMYGNIDFVARFKKSRLYKNNK